MIRFTDLQVLIGGISIFWFCLFGIPFIATAIEGLTRKEREILADEELLKQEKREKMSIDLKIKK